MRPLLDFVLFYAGWFACVAGAGAGRLWLGPAVTAAIVALHLVRARDRASETRFLLMAAGAGFVLDTALATAGLYAFEGTSPAPWISPPWMVSLWILFATTLSGPLAWLAGRPFFAALLGAVFGPLSYWAGERLGAITLGANRPLVAAALAIAWALALPALFWLRTRRDTSSGVRSAATAIAALAMLATFGSENARAAAPVEIEGVRFSGTHRVEDLELRLHCTGLLRYRVLFKGYVAALYLGPGVAPNQVLGDVPKRLELQYFWSIPGSEIAAAGDRILADNVDAITFARLRPQLDRLNALYQDVAPGDRYALTYVPGLGLELALNGERKGLIPGDELAREYFRIWLGERPIDTGLRDRLLACSEQA